MIRSWTLAAVLAGCAGSDVVPVVFDHRSVLDVETRGIALSRDGARGHVGMYGVTCDFQTRTALVGSDYDFPSETETVQDGNDVPGIGFATVTSSPDRVHLTTLDDGMSWDIPVPDVVHTRLTDDDIVVLGGASSCGAAWVGVDRLGPPDRLVGDLPASACDEGASVSADAEGDEVYVATDEGVFVLTKDGWTFIGVRADVIAWDPWASALYAANLGGSEVHAYEADGRLRWSVDTGGEVRDLDHLGELAAATVMVETTSGGAIVVLDGATGEQRADVETPGAADSIVVADSGKVVGLQLKMQTHFYDVRISD